MTNGSAVSRSFVLECRRRIGCSPFRIRNAFGRRRLEGTTIVEGQIGTDGFPTAMRVVSSEHPDLGMAAIERLKGTAMGARTRAWRRRRVSVDGDGQVQPRPKLATTWALNLSCAPLPHRLQRIADGVEAGPDDSGDDAEVDAPAMAGVD